MDCIWQKKAVAKPYRLLGSERFISLIDQLKEQFDYVVMDTPPLELIRDAEIISETADAMLMVMRQDEVHAVAVNDAVDLLEENGVTVIGGVLNICPLLNMDNLGRLIPRYKIRTKRKVIRAIVDKMAEYADHQTDYTGKCYISHSGCYEDAKAVADLVQSRFPYLKEKVEINNVGTTIGSHTGPGTVALFFWGDTRTE